MTKDELRQLIREQISNIKDSIILLQNDNHIFKVGNKVN